MEWGEEQEEASRGPLPRREARTRGDQTTRATRRLNNEGDEDGAPFGSAQSALFQAFRAVIASIAGLNHAAVSRIGLLRPRAGPESTVSR